MRFTVESWDPEFGSPMETAGNGVEAPRVDPAVETPPEKWTPRTPPATAPLTVLFVDGVRRIDARVWIQTRRGVEAGICATYAAGAVRCNREARLEAAEVERTLTAPAPEAGIITRFGDYAARAVTGEDGASLINGLREDLRVLELRVAGLSRGADLVVLDGPLTRSVGPIGAVGYIKTHQVEYLPVELRPLVARLKPGQRTPLFVTQTSWSRYSWYLRLPGGSGHPWAGVARCELPARLTVQEASRRADQVTAQLPRFASASHKEPRAPQNLYPIAGLERRLRRLLGDPRLMYRALREASVAG